MEFRVLGPLEVVDDGRQVDLGGQKQRALLAILLLHANEVVSTDRLIEALWEDEPPETAQKALQVYVSQLRKTLGRERIVTSEPGYVLRIDQAELDLDRFIRLVEEGQPKEALALWRGPPLAEFAYSRFAQSEIARLEDLRLAAVEGRIEQDLATGRHGALVGELEGLVAAHPLRERLRGQLMLALYRSGRQAEALEAYQDARRVLTDELGIDPGRKLRELQQAILRQDRTLDLVAEEGAEEREELPADAPPVERERPVHEMRKTVSAIYVGLSAPTDSASADPEALRRVTGPAFGLVEEAVDRHGGSLETVTGDAVEAVFGLPAVHEDDALRAVRAAVEIKEALEALAESGARVDFRIGISTGEVIAGGLRVAGEPLLGSARLGRAAQAGDVIFDANTRYLLRDTAVVEEMSDGFRLVQLLDSGGGAQASRFGSPMVGRVREHRRLQDAFEQAVADQSCQLFTVLGTAGVGKSRLVREFLGDVGERALVTRGRCLPYGEGITYWPVLEAVKDAAALDEAEGSDEARRKIAALLEHDQEAELVAQRVAETIGLAEAAGGAIEDSFRALRAFFEAVAERSPLVLVFDDIHWGESTFLDFVEHVADWSRSVPILLICMARPELLEVRPGWGGGKLNATSLLLEPLSDAESVELVENLARDSLEDATRRRIVEAAEGNPLFVEEMLALVGEDAGPDADVDVPPTIQALLAARLDRLDGGERLAIEAAAAEGKLFHESSVAELLPPGRRASIHDHLMALVRKDLVRPDRPLFPGERAFRFRHLLIRDAAYESISKQARAEMHAGYARWLEQKAADRAPEYAEILGYHLERAYRYRAELGRVDEEALTLAHEAAEHLGAAGRRAFARSDSPAAMNLIVRAVALLEPDDPLRVDLIPNVRAVQGWTTELQWAETVLEEAIAAGDRRLTAHARVQQGLLRLFTAAAVQPEGLIGIAEETIPVFEEFDDEVGLARAWRLIAQAEYLARRAGLSTEASWRALEHARRARDRFEQREIVEWLVVTLALGPTPAPEAARECERLLGELPEDSVLEAIVVGALWYLRAIQERPDDALTVAQRGRRSVHEVGGVLIWLFPASLAWIALFRSEPSAAEHELRPVYDELRNLGEKSHFSSVTTVLAQAVYAQGRYDEAEKLALEAEEASRPNDVHSQIISRATRAKVLARRGEFEAAEELVREAVAFAEQSDFLHSHADACIDLAEVLRLAGRREEAAEAIRKAIALHERKGNVLGAAQARAVLEELAS